MIAPHEHHHGHDHEDGDDNADKLIKDQIQNYLSRADQFATRVSMLYNKTSMA